MGLEWLTQSGPGIASLGRPIFGKLSGPCLDPFKSGLTKGDGTSLESQAGQPFMGLEWLSKSGPLIVFQSWARL